MFEAFETETYEAKARKKTGGLEPPEPAPDTLVERGDLLLAPDEAARYDEARRVRNRQHERIVK